MNGRPRLVVITLTSLLFATSAASAADLFGIDSFNLYDIDTTAGTATNLGPITGGSPFGFGLADSGPNGTLYSVVPGLISGYSLYSVDPNTLAATLLHQVSANQAGNVGLAVDPSGVSLWVAGFVGFSLNVNVQEIDIGSGAVTDHGSFAGNAWGLAFDAAGNLFSSIQGPGSDAILIQVDKANAGNSTAVGPMTGLDFSFGLDLASDVGGGVTAFSRNTDDVFSVDTSTGAVTLVSNIAGASAIFTIAGNNACTGSAINYGSGCPGSGGFVPVLAVNGCPEVGESIAISITSGLGGATALLFFGFGQTSIPVGGGCTYHIGTTFPASLALPLGGTGFGGGNTSLSAPVLPSISGLSVVMQAWVIDSTSVIGGAGTNGVEMTVP